MISKKIILYLSLPASLLIAFVSIFAICTPGFYKLETANWQAQSQGQDMVDLFLAAPVLLISSWLASAGRERSFLIWGGAVLYLLYSFVIFCFDVHFNSLFAFYCLILGLLFYSALYFLARLIRSQRSLIQIHVIDKITAWFFLIVAVLFYFLWLSEILPAMIKNSAPASLAEVGLPTNAVHVIDLSVFLPFLFIVGILILRRNSLGPQLAIAALAFCVLMDITIGGLTIYMYQKQVSDSLAVAYIMVFLTLISAILLFLNLRKWRALGTV